MLILKREGFEVETDSPRVSSEDAATVDAAVQIVEAAKAEAAQIVEAARTEAAEIVETAKAEREDEMKRGYEDGLSKANAEMLKNKIHLVGDADDYVRRAERDLSNVVLEALRRCIGEVGADEIVMRLVTQGLDTVAKRQKYVKVSVSPKMLDDVGARIRALQARYPTILSFEVEAAEDLKETGCRIQTDAGVVQGSFEDQIAAIEEAMKRRFEERT